MEVKINKDIREYTESVVLGLSLRQCFFSVLACIMAVIFYFLFIDSLGMEITSWLCILSAVPFASLGFIRYQGMNAEQIAKNAWRSFLLINQKLVFKPQNLYYEFLQETIQNHRKESMNKNDKKLRKTKKTKQRKNESA